MNIKHIITLLLLFLPLVVTSQEIKILSFTPDDSDVTANLAGTTVYDQNGDKCALIKIETPHTGFAFDVGLLGIVKTEYHTGEIWLYVPHGVKRITISHPTLGVVRDYDLGMSVKQARTYILKLVATKVPGSNPALMQQFVLFNVTPTNSYVEFDGEPLIVQNGKAHKLKPFGTYKYTVSSNNYHTQTGEVTISDLNNRKEVEVNLLPAFGQLTITSENLHGAYIYINDEMIGQAPIINKKLPSGKHKIVVVKPLYKKYETTITITDGEQKQFAPILQPNYADVTLTTDTNSEIWINGENKGKGSFTGKLEIGSYMVECKRLSHTTTKEIVDITESGVKNIKLQIPQPIYGMVTISADQPDANIYLDGKNIGLTPQYLPQTLIGTHTIKITKPGCADWVSNITISEGKLTEVNATLQTGKEVQFISTKTDATLYIDGEYKGSANGAYTLTYGTHNIVCKSAGEKDFTTTITVAPTKDIQKVECSFLNPIEVIAELSKDEMVYVEGGPFTMGATVEQGADANSDEKPTHQVTLSSYYIGKYEVTQQLWEYVMSYSGVAADGTTMSAYSSDVWLGSNNPTSTNGRGNYYPAYYVSYNDIVNIFLPRLNKITGGKYRLPTEAEWEYAARGGNKSKGYKYSGSNTIDNVAWYRENSGSKTHIVGTKQANELGIYDMSGNVWEWCSDWYGRYSSSAQTNPTGPTTGSYRVNRGGSWVGAVSCQILNGRVYCFADDCRVSIRISSSPGGRSNSLGFRLASSL